MEKVILFHGPFTLPISHVIFWMLRSAYCRYPLPEIPAGWKPDPKRVWVQNQTQPSDSVNKENLNQAATAASGPMPHSKWKTSGLSADEVRTLQFT